MAQQARQALTIAPRHLKPPVYGGTDASWRVLCDLYPAAETPEIIMAVVEYCAARNLDPFRRPVHVVPMWNTKLRRRVQVVMQGINEIETTAHRTARWAGMDLPQWGPAHRRKFRGTTENDDGSTSNVEIELEFPLWCAVTVYRLVGKERRPFTEQLFWEESYATDAFRSEVPNARWRKAPRQMLHKCTKAAVLRAAFPEESFGYAAEEMEDREIDAGGVTIEGHIDHGQAPPPDYGMRVAGGMAHTPTEPPSSQAPDEATDPLAELEEQDSGPWLKALERLLRAAASEDELHAIRSHHSVHRALAQAPSLIRKNIEDWLREAHERITAQAADAAEAEIENPEPPADWQDPIGPLLADVATMDLIALAGLAANAQWRARVRDATANFPPDEDRLREAIENRKAELQGKRQ